MNSSHFLENFDCFWSNKTLRFAQGDTWVRKVNYFIANGADYTTLELECKLSAAS